MSTTANVLAAVPRLDDIARDPTRASGLAPDVARALHSQCVIVLTALLPSIAPASAPAATPTPEASKLLKPDEASARFNLSKRWLLGHAADIPGTVRLSRKTVLFDEARLSRWLERHRPQR